MKTITQKRDSEARKMTLYVTLAGYAIIVVFAILRVLTDFTEWREERKKIS